MRCVVSIGAVDVLTGIIAVVGVIENTTRKVGEAYDELKERGNGMT